MNHYLLLKKNWQIFFLVLLVLFHFIANVIWIQLNKTPLSWDPANHAYTAHAIKECIIHYSGISKCLEASTFYPIFSQSILAFNFIIFSTSTFVSRVFSTTLFVLLLIIVYLWSKEYSKSKFIAIVTTFITSFIPILYEHSRAFWLELPVVIINYLYFYLIIKSNKFKNTKYFYISFVLLGIGIATRVYTAVYFFIPFIFVLRKSLKESNENIYLKLTKGTAIAFTIGLPWYLYNIEQFLYYTKRYTLPDTSEPQNIFSVSNFIWYLNQIINYELMLPLFLILIASTIYLVFSNKLPNLKKTQIFLYIFFVYIIFTVIGNKDLRYMLPLLPLFALIISYLVLGIQNKYKVIGSFFIFIFFSYLIINYLILSFNFLVKKDFKKSFYLSPIGYIDYINLTNYPVQSYSKENWPVKEVLKDISYIEGKRQVVLHNFIEYPFLNSRNLLFGTKELDDNNIILQDDFGFIEGAHLKSNKEIIEYLKTKDYILISSNAASMDYFIHKKSLDRIQSVVLTNINQPMFLVVKRYKIPYEVLQDQIMASDLPNIKGPRDKICQIKRCDEMYLIKVIK